MEKIAAQAKFMTWQQRFLSWWHFCQNFYKTWVTQGEHDIIEVLVHLSKEIENENVSVENAQI